MGARPSAPAVANATSWFSAMAMSNMTDQRTECGITGFGVYVPRLRLQRAAVYEANAWFAPGLKGLSKGERAVANWDEDVVTMAVEAGRAALAGADRNQIDTV